jgi:hypothetical protein
MALASSTTAIAIATTATVIAFIITFKFAFTIFVTVQEWWRWQ